jgi:hypothetical protein
VILRANTAYQPYVQNAVNWAEKQSNNSVLYALGAYSDWKGTWEPSGDESALGRGTGCSGFIAGSMNEVPHKLELQLELHYYKPGERLAAATALYNAIYSKVYDKVGIKSVAKNLTDQVVNCFAFGGLCASVDHLWLPGTLGEGPSISPDDLMPAQYGGVQKNWTEQPKPAIFGGGKWVQVVDEVKFQCCWTDGYSEHCRTPNYDQDSEEPPDNGDWRQPRGSGEWEVVAAVPDELCVRERPLDSAVILPNVRCLDLEPFASRTVFPSPEPKAPVPIEQGVGAASPDGWDHYAVDLREVPLIESVTVDPPTVCVGKGAEIRVQLTPGNENASVSIGEYRGNPVVLTAKGVGAWKVNVVAKDAMGRIDSVEATVEAVDCPGTPNIVPMHYISPWETDAAVFTVGETNGLGQGVEYEWDFGDGECARTSLGMVTHSYALRDQAGAGTSYVVNVCATDQAGNRACNNHSVTLTNQHWLANLGEAVTLPAEFERFPVREDRQWVSSFKFRNILGESVTLRDLQVTGHSQRHGRRR